MQNFVYHNPVRLVFGRGTIARLAELAPAGATVLMTYGGDYGIDGGRFAFIAERIAARGAPLGERQDLGREAILAILEAAR